MKIAICAIAKNENKYILEWVNWYKKLNVSSIYIYDNNDLNGEDINDVINNDNIVYIDKTYKGKHDKFYQSECYTNFYNENKLKYDWILFCDIDEFLYLENFNSIEDFINSNNNFNNYDAIAICWKIYDDNNLVYYENKPLLERFTHPAVTTNNDQIKSLVKCRNKNLSFCAHGAYNIKYCNVLGEELINFKFPKINSKPIHKICWINHYRYKTIEEYILSKYKNFTQKNIYSKYIDFKYFFEVNKFTEEKLNVIKSFGLNYEHNIK